MIQTSMLVYKLNKIVLNNLFSFTNGHIQNVFSINMASLILYLFLFLIILILYFILVILPIQKILIKLHMALVTIKEDKKVVFYFIYFIFSFFFFYLSFYHSNHYSFFFFKFFIDLKKLHILFKDPLFSCLIIAKLHIIAQAPKNLLFLFIRLYQASALFSS